MKNTGRRSMSRRTLLGALAAFPAFLPRARALAADSVAAAPKSAADVLSVMDFEALARAALPPAHFGYIATGNDDDLTVARNHDAFGHYEIRARRFNDLRALSTATTVFGVPWPSPLYASAVSSMRAFHPDAEIAVAQAAKSRATQLMISSGASTPLEPIVVARGAPVWHQLYPTDDWSVARGVIHRAEKAGCPAVVLTVDSPSGKRNLETLKRMTLLDPRDCSACHTPESRLLWKRSPIYSDLDVSRVQAISPAGMPPEYLRRAREAIKGKFIIKGIVTGEDAVIALDAGADAIVVSNHGGRNEETLRATIDCLPEVAVAVRGRVPIFLDGGVRRGTDVFKALALGATAVGIGRPQVWGLAAFGQSGVEAVIDILNAELLNIMRQAGTANVAAITAASVLRSTDSKV